MGGIVRSIFGGGMKAPKADPAIGQAAQVNAEVGREALQFAREQATITNAWAEQDRARDVATFRPLQDQMIAEARAYDTPARRGIRRSAAGADVEMAAAQARAGNQRAMARMGIDPRSGRAAGVRAEQDMRTTLAKAGAMTQQDRLVEGEAYARMGNAVNMGAGLAVNPLASIQAGNNAVQSGSGSAMAGNRDVMGAYQHADNMKFRAYETNMAALGELAGAGGMYLGMQSSRDSKTDKKPSSNNLAKLQKLPIEEWRYKDGVADGGAHVGTYAEDFKKVTGKGDGKQIPVVDAIGMTMGAIQELASKVDKLSVTRRAA